MEGVGSFRRGSCQNKNATVILGASNTDAKNGHVAYAAVAVPVLVPAVECT